MSRPAAPSWTIPVHAPDVNYPVSADPWSATPTKQAHPGSPSVGFTPKSGVAAQCVNKLIYDAYVADGNAKTSISNLYTYLANAWAMSWGAPVAAMTGIRDVIWNPKERRWYALGGTDLVYYSADNGFTWTSSSAIAGVAGTHACYTGASDTAGNMVVLNDHRDIYEYTQATTTWAKRANALTAALIDSEGCFVLYDTVHSKWVAVYEAAGGVKVDTSTDRITWTNRTVSTHTGFTGVGFNATSGRILTVEAVFGSPTLYIAKSDDGGVTWSDLSTVTAAGNADLTRNRITYDATTGLWYLTGNGLGKDVWTSADDGATWSHPNTGNFSSQDIVTDGEMVIVARETDNDFIFSTDRGVTWRSSNYVAPSTILRMKFNGTHLMAVINGSKVCTTSFGVNSPPALF